MVAFVFLFSSNSTVLGLLTWCKLFFINIFREL